jgi:hypothetical protein
MTRFGKVAYAITAIVAITTLNYKWLALGLFFLAIDIFLWLWFQPGYDAAGPGKRPSKAPKHSDHFLYFHLFDNSNKDDNNQ